MMDFTLDAYREYLNCLQSSGKEFLRFDEFMLTDFARNRSQIVLLRHDVDRMPRRALRMAKLEHALGVVATYYFRAKPGSFNAEIMSEIASMGHEVGYHYEVLSDCNGNEERALELFRENLTKFRKYTPISTISMHGRPLSSIDNRDLWKKGANKIKLTEEFSIQGEVYLDIDYTDIAYITDTGRNWRSSAANLRDTVKSNIDVDFKHRGELLVAFQSNTLERIVFQIHPERWADNFVEWVIQYMQDSAINLVKQTLKLMRKRPETEK